MSKLNASIRSPLQGCLKNLGAETRGAVTIEFALSSIVLMGFMACATDALILINQQRDVDRMATQIAMSLAACPDSNCVTSRLTQINERRNHLLTGITAPVLGMAEFNVKGTAYPVSVGNMTYLPTDLLASAKATCGDNDVGIAVAIDAKPSVFFGWVMGKDSYSLRATSVAIRAKDQSVL